MLLRRYRIASSCASFRYIRVCATRAIKWTAKLTSHHAKATARKANRANHGPRVLAKRRVRQTRELGKLRDIEKFQECQSFVQGQKVRKTGLSVLKTRNQRQVKKHRNLNRCAPLTFPTLTILGLMMAGVMTSGVMNGARLAGRRFGKKPTTFHRKLTLSWKF